MGIQHSGQSMVALLCTLSPSWSLATSSKVTFTKLTPLAVHNMAILCGDNMGEATAAPIDSTNHAKTKRDKR
jgi:hypothetical protein